MRKTLSDKGIAALKPRPKRYAYADPELRGHYVRVTPAGVKSFAAIASTPDGRQVWTTIGAADVITVGQAREQARVILQRVRAGLPAVEPKAETFGEVVANWRKRHVERNGLRSRDEIVRLLERHILPAWGEREFTTIRKSDIAALLDRIEDDRGARTADYCLSIIHSVMHWLAARHDDYNPPVVRTMRRQSTKAQARERILSDDELRAIWTAAKASGTFGAILQLCLLTAQRSRKVTAMRWADISNVGEWTIPKAPREKDTGGILVLPELALAIIRAQSRLGDNPYVFAGRGAGAFRGFSKSKRRFDAMLPPGTPDWVIHDLRRTARSLMSRAGVRPNIGERVLGHVIGGVEGVYDRHAYKGEKAGALAQLAALIEGIVHPRDNVTPMVKRTKRRRDV
jgi:integrase